jgi:hypothetical protein
MSRMLFVALTSICWASPIKAEVTLSCSGTMKAEEEQAKPHAITKMGLIVNFDAGVVTGFTEITARKTRSTPTPLCSTAPLSILQERNGQSMAPLTGSQARLVRP